MDGSLTKLHLDTDLGADPDDVCALVLLAGWTGVELVGVTTNLDQDGERAGCAALVLELLGAVDVRVVAGAGSSSTSGRVIASTASDPRYWPVRPAARPAAPGAALDLLLASIEAGATLVTIGALTNLALLEVLRPGSLAEARVVAMGGWVRPFAPGLPPWGPARDFNVQVDPLAMRHVARAAGHLTLATLPACGAAHLRRADLPEIEACGEVGRLLARQAVAYAEDKDRAALAAAHPALPDDLLNFHWDPVTVAVAAGWDGVTVERMRLGTDIDEQGVLHWRPDPTGRPVDVVTEVDGDAFRRRFAAGVSAAVG